jgi:hypothetical protein
MNWIMPRSAPADKQDSMIVRDVLDSEFEAIKLGGMWADLRATKGTAF